MYARIIQNNYLPWFGPTRAVVGSSPALYVCYVYMFEAHRWQRILRIWSRTSLCFCFFLGVIIARLVVVRILLFLFVQAVEFRKHVLRFFWLSEFGVDPAQLIVSCDQPRVVPYGLF